MLLFLFIFFLLFITIIVPEIESSGLFVSIEPAKQSKESNQNIPGHSQNFFTVCGFTCVSTRKVKFNKTQAPSSGEGSGACFSKVQKSFGPTWDPTIRGFIFSQRRGSKSSNFTILFVFLALKTW